MQWTINPGYAEPIPVGFGDGLLEPLKAGLLYQASATALAAELNFLGLTF